MPGHLLWRQHHMATGQFVAVRCKFSKGLFYCGRAVEVTLADGNTHSGPAPLHYCLNDAGQPLNRGEAIDEEIDGWVAARRLDRPLQGDQVGVEVPDGEAIAVRKSQLRDDLTFPAEQRL